jgi:very-short-patch-repair endonuclease
VARVDFAWPAARLIVEADGFAYHSDRESYRRDRERLNHLERLGWRVLRFTWEDVVSRPEYVTNLVGAVLRQVA